MAERSRLNWFWLAAVALGLVRQVVEYGVASGLILSVVLVPFSVVVKRWSRRSDPVNAWRLMALILGVAAVVELCSAPFARSSSGTADEVGARAVAFQAGIVSTVGAMVCWLVAHHADREHSRRS